MSSEVKTNVGMGCFEHPEKTVVATCPKCGKFMCKECAEKYESKLCDKCEEERLKEVEANREKVLEHSKDCFKEARKIFIKQAILAIVLGVIGFAAGSSEGVSMGIMMAWMLAGFPFGWEKIKNLLDADDLLWLIAWTKNMWFIAIIIKFALAMLIGAFLLPIRIFQMVKGIIDSKKGLAQVEEMKKK